MIELLKAIKQDAEWARECLEAGGAIGGRSADPRDRALTYVERIESRCAAAIAQAPSQEVAASTAISADDGSKTGLVGYVEATLDLSLAALVELRQRLDNMQRDKRLSSRDFRTLYAFDAFQAVRAHADALASALEWLHNARDELRDA